MDFCTGGSVVARVLEGLPILPLSRGAFTHALDSRSERSVSGIVGNRRRPLIWLLRLKTLLRDLILPPAGPLLLALLGLLLLKVRPLLGRACLIAGLALLWLLSTPIVSDALTGLVELYPPLELRQAATAQAIVILGGGGQRALAPEYGGAAAKPFLLERLSYGAYVAQKTGLPILVTGFSVEAHAMHDSLQRNFGIETQWIDDQAYDTFQNARNSARILGSAGVHRIVLVTRATHMRRAVREFADAGFDVVAAPAGMREAHDYDLQSYLPDPEALLYSHMAIYELLGEPVRMLLSVSHLRRH
jgi:uncharacterized SAM-binding protein YcdF (DUF218 family)